MNRMALIQAMSDNIAASKRPRSSDARRVLAKIPGLRSAWHLGRTIQDVWLDSSEYSQVELQQEFSRPDPWRYSTDELEKMRHCGELAMLDRVRGKCRFERVLELGCAEGIFTEFMASRGDSLVAADFNAVALQRARERCQQYPHIQFASIDLRAEPLPGIFDLICAVHVLEYIQNPLALGKIREKIVTALRPGGYLLLGCVSFASPVDKSWWSKFLLRGGEHINGFFARHPQLTVVDSAIHPLTRCDSFDILLRKTP